MADEKYINLDTMGNFMKQVKSKIAERYVRKSHGHADIQNNISTEMNKISNTSGTGAFDRLKIIKDKLIVIGKTAINSNEANYLNTTENGIQSILRSQSNNMIMESKDDVDYYSIPYNNEITSYSIKTNRLTLNKGDVIDIYESILDFDSIKPANATSIPKFLITDTSVIDIVPENFTLLVANKPGVTELTFVFANNIDNVVKIVVV